MAALASALHSVELLCKTRHIFRTSFAARFDGFTWPFVWERFKLLFAAPSSSQEVVWAELIGSRTPLMILRDAAICGCGTPKKCSSALAADRESV